VAGIESVLASGPRTPDLGGAATTQEVGRAIAQVVGSLPEKDMGRSTS
jgi:tartrate dehydrogenase/decarboxylase/D-malate dehydrogenase